MVETEPTGCKENMAAKGDRAKTLDNALLTHKHQSASIKSFTSGTDTFVSLPMVTGHGKSFILQAYQPSLPFAEELQKHSEL